MAATREYRGAAVCDLVPDWLASGDLRLLLDACHAADPDELTPQLALADWLAEHGDPRERWVRVGVSLWEACRSLSPAPEGWSCHDARSALEPVCRTVTGWRMSCVWGCLVAWHCPSGVADEPMGRTWTDSRVRTVNRYVWWWAM